MIETAIESVESSGLGANGLVRLRVKFFSVELELTQTGYKDFMALFGARPAFVPAEKPMAGPLEWNSLYLERQIRIP